MLDCAGLNHAALFLEVLDDLLVSILDVQPLEVRDLVSEPTRGVQRTDHLDNQKVRNYRKLITS